MTIDRLQGPADGRAARAATCTPLPRARVMLGDSPAMAALRLEIERIARSDATVLVIGESGTGKELVARALHDASPRRDGPFIAVNCAAIAPGLIEAELFGHERGSFTGAHRQRVGYFERASAGTLFLDEISEMPLEMQVRLLRVLEGRTFERVGGSETIASTARVVAASNRDLVLAARGGQFRTDLLYRLAVLPLRVPALRDREDDIVQLAHHFVAELNTKGERPKRLSRHAQDRLRTWPCPGNVRELRNLIHRAFILATDDVVEVDEFLRARDDVRPRVRGAHLEIALGTRLDVAQRELIMATLAKCDGNKTRAAAALGISAKTMHTRLDLYRERPTVAP